MFGLCLPSHTIYIVSADGTRESTIIGDYTSRQEIRKAIGKWIAQAIQYRVKKRNTDFENWESIEYVDDRTKEVLYQCSVQECLDEIGYK